MTRDEIITEMRELDQDLLAFKKARDILGLRLLELENNPERHSMMADWPVFKVVDNSLIVAIVKCEGLLEDYWKLLGPDELPDNVVELRRRP